MKLYEKALQIIDKYIQDEHKGNSSSAARALNVNIYAFIRWTKRERTPNSEDIFNILEKIGVGLSLPSDGSPPEPLPPNLPALTPPEADSLRAAIERIQHLERKLDEKEKQIEELIKYRHQLEGFMELEVKKAQAARGHDQPPSPRSQSLLPSSAPPGCSGEGSEARELLRPGGHGPPEHDDSVRR